MGLRRLHHFVTLIEQGSFARAADALHLSQPALSRSIQALEADYGCALVDRSYGKAGTTAAGTMVLARARRMLREGRELRRELQLLQDIEIGSLRPGFGPFAAAFLLEPVLAALVTRHPRLGIDRRSPTRRAWCRRWRLSGSTSSSARARARPASRTCISIACPRCRPASSCAPATRWPGGAP